MEEKKNITILSERQNKAMTLDISIKAHAQLAQQSLYEVCKGLKEMRDSKLYKELNYQNFEDYCKSEIGFERRQVYRLISIAENLSNDFVTSMSQIGTTKLSLLARLDDPEREQIQQETDLQNTSVRQLKEKIKELEAEKKQSESALQEKQETISKLEAENEGYSEMQTELETRIITLEQEKEELENRPAEVAVQEIHDEKYIENRIAQALENNARELIQQNQKLQDDNLQEICNLKREHQEEISTLKDQLSEKDAELMSMWEQLSEKTKQNALPDKETFRAYLSTAADSMKRLLQFLEKYPQEFYFSKLDELLASAKANADMIQNQEVK